MVRDHYKIPCDCEVVRHCRSAEGYFDVRRRGTEVPQELARDIIAQPKSTFRCANMEELSWSWKL